MIINQWLFVPGPAGRRARPGSMPRSHLHIYRDPLLVVVGRILAMVKQNRNFVNAAKDDMHKLSSAPRGEPKIRGDSMHTLSSAPRGEPDIRG